MALRGVELHATGQATRKGNSRPEGQVKRAADPYRE